MKTEIEDELFADFSNPENLFDPITVSCCQMDGSTMQIGRIYQDFGNEEGEITYISTNNEGEELFPPAEDWATVENKFEKFAKMISERQQEINMLRGIKNNQQQTINR
ncbi:MAG: hypothetical protein WAV23_02885 [Minisyncoccia bacterium]